MWSDVLAFLVQVSVGLVVLAAACTGIVVVQAAVLPATGRAARNALIRWVDDCAVQSRPVLLASVLTLALGYLHLETWGVVFGRPGFVYCSLIPLAGACLVLVGYLVSKVWREFRPLFRGNTAIWPGNIARDWGAVAWLIPLFAMPSAGSVAGSLWYGITGRPLWGLAGMTRQWLLAVPFLGVVMALWRLSSVKGARTDLEGAIEVRIAHSRLHKGLAIVGVLLVCLVAVTVMLAVKPHALQALGTPLYWAFAAGGRGASLWWGGLPPAQRFCFMYLVSVTLPVVSVAAASLLIHVSLAKVGESPRREAEMLSSKVRPYLEDLVQLGLTGDEMRRVAAVYAMPPSVEALREFVSFQVRGWLDRFASVAISGAYGQLLEEMDKSAVELNYVSGNRWGARDASFSLKAVLKVCRAWALYRQQTPGPAVAPA